MKRAARCVALALSLSATPVAAAAPYAPPAPDVLSALARQHHPHDWWRVTVDSARYEVRVRTVGAAGIAGLQPRHRSDLEQSPRILPVARSYPCSRRVM